ncbi:hypothetical protein GGU10DRAFT_268129 [Lentinula aff. detonsa]|uniref:Prolyl 4-hydroxylase alpha subunit Fe(2+) 2OG dioxygenase domain-containing protein n=1 Tax=Lentinula aff. detonsa TaxID=2804958 RepID=A0AA38KWH7_9AGAR|nr:hypothetical protein GGU10DRAFT_268129 [Lentinula aff. detonsa]
MNVRVDASTTQQNASIHEVEELEIDDEVEEDDGVSSSTSEGGDLREDLEKVLEGDFNFKGSYAHSSLFSDAPNPVLNVTGVGLIGLPLSPRDAQLIISSATQAPFGHGTETKVDTNVRHTWEIEPARVSFGNVAWQAWLKETVVKSVATALGVPVSETPPRCELYKLLLYEQGSQCIDSYSSFLPHQDTVKAQNMFATIIVVLPSPYTGGQVHISHSSSKQIFSFDSNSLLSTAVMAWYTDVQHEVKPITSGYRLALSYNLIHVTPGLPPPILPNMHSSVASLRRVLEKWRAQKYADEQGMVGHILTHQYSPAGLCMGFKALKGQDSYLVAQLMPLAAEQGFFVGLANFTCHETGTADGDGGYSSYYKRRRGYGGYGRYRDDDYEDDDDDEEVPGMEEVLDTTITVKNLVDMEGNKPAGDNEIPFDWEDLVQQDPFEDAVPDVEQYEGYMGNVSHWYKRTILIIATKETAHSILYAASYALENLRRASLERPGNPSSEDLSFANMLVNNPEKSPATLVQVARYAVSWNDLELWMRVLRASYWGHLPVDELVAGWKAFSFNRVSSSFEQLIRKASPISHGISFVQELVESGPLEDRQLAQGWSAQLVSQLLTTVEAPTVQDVPLFIETTKKQGLSYITNTLIPRLEKNPSLHDFWVALIKELESNRASLVMSPEGFANQDGKSLVNKSSVRNLITRCLFIIITNWEHGLTAPVQSRYYPYHQSPSDTSLPSRITELAHLCVCARFLDPLTKLWRMLAKAKPLTVQENFRIIYSPLIPQLRQLLKSQKLDLASPPFLEFIQVVLGSYLRFVLGPRPDPTALMPARKLGCGCLDCEELDKFLMSTSLVQTFWRVQKIRTHLERQMNSGRDIVTYSTIRSGSPHGLVVKRNQQAAAYQSWLQRQGQAKTFLGTIGSGSILQKVAGPRYADVLKALEGKKQFVLPWNRATSSASNQPS